MEAMGRLMFQSHESSVSYFENSCPELDILVRLASQQEGCLGARLSGGGFGGATINLVRSEAAESFKQKVARAYEAATGIQALVLETPACDGAK
ncbi:MAG: hypothetical protein HC904_10405 [Blastochloris sp.]|nr:hypothetical protein [Blastochloris sp.]